MQQAGESTLVKGMLARVKARDEWERANVVPLEDPGYPDRTRSLAAAWDLANREDHERTQRIEWEERQREADEKVPSILERWGAPMDAVAKLPTLRAEGAVSAALDFIPSDKLALALLGAVGRGKTLAAVRVLAWAARKGYSGAFTTAAAFARLGYDDGKEIERLSSVRLLVLDDLGSEHLTPFGMSQLEDLFRRRLATPGLRTVITSNLSRVDFRARYGERVTDRLAEVGVSHVATGPSLRRRG